ncbi:TetR/AcrR family transcriptional regulator [Streptomyces smyrnaeus]|uniref:TetR/AcrR family transcriptional regulator n=1 Tax=Streptomyces smyrnaeus TaxID=1387713 RepID=A0ABS3XSS3_9ACTN|nr:TetR/AcrR family transcriptional regulator [Streptomyces smyrnaeus]MBO8198448.1 TetR/AcrR family transcriptional regulator [Streptomyces smyrnaeus]
MQTQKDVPGPPGVPRRCDAQRNRKRLLEAALAELTCDADAPLSRIARKAGVGQGTFYRNFPNREALLLEVYRHELQQVADSADELLLRCRGPEQALRAWMDHLARFASTKAGLSDALREATSAPGDPAKPAPVPVARAADRLLSANEKAGTIRPGVRTEDFLLAITGLWHVGAQEGAYARATRLLDLVMDGLRVRP